MHEGIRKIIDAGIQELQRVQSSVSKQLIEVSTAVDRTKAEMETLVSFAESIPSRIFDRFSNVYIGELHIQDKPLQGQPAFDMRFYNGYFQPHMVPAIGGDLNVGKYRVIVTLEKVSP